MSREDRKRERDAERTAKRSGAFGRYTRWVPEDLPAAAVAHWPQKKTWPSVADVRVVLDATESDLDARLGIMTGLRRWSEPGSSQMLVSFASFIVALVAIAIGVSDFYPNVFIWVLVVGIVYIFVAGFGFSQAMQIEERRKMAHGWLRAIEDELDFRKTSTKVDPPLPRRPWFRAWGIR
jgi:hypothetical protein